MSYAMLGQQVSSVALAGLGDITLGTELTNMSPLSDELVNNDIIHVMARNSDGSKYIEFWTEWTTGGVLVGRHIQMSYDSVAVPKRSKDNLVIDATWTVEVIEKDMGCVGRDATSIFIPDNLMRYNHAGGKGGGSFTSQAGRIVLEPIALLAPRRIASVGASLTTASAGGLFRVGMYHRNQDGSWGDLIYDSGDIGTDTATHTLVALPSPIILPPGLYYTADRVDNVVATARGNRLSSDSFLNHYGFGSKPYFNGTYGAFPTTLGIEDGTTNWESFGTYFR